MADQRVVVADEDGRGCDLVGLGESEREAAEQRLDERARLGCGRARRIEVQVQSSAAPLLVVERQRCAGAEPVLPHDPVERSRESTALIEVGGDEDLSVGGAPVVRRGSEREPRSGPEQHLPACLDDLEGVFCRVDLRDRDARRTDRLQNPVGDLGEARLAVRQHLLDLTDPLGLRHGWTVPPLVRPHYERECRSAASATSSSVGQPCSSARNATSTARGSRA